MRKILQKHPEISCITCDYDRRSLILKLSHTDPYDIVRISRTYGDGGGKKKALHRIVNIYITMKMKLTLYLLNFKL